MPPTITNITVLPKLDLNCKTEVSIKRGLGKKISIFLGLSVRENPDETRLTSSSFSESLWFASL